MGRNLAGELIWLGRRLTGRQKIRDAHFLCIGRIVGVVRVVGIVGVFTVAAVADGDDYLGGAHLILDSVERYGSGGAGPDALLVFIGVGAGVGVEVAGAVLGVAAGGAGKLDLGDVAHCGRDGDGLALVNPVVVVTEEGALGQGDSHAVLGEGLVLGVFVAALVGTGHEDHGAAGSAALSALGEPDGEGLGGNVGRGGHGDVGYPFGVGGVGGEVDGDCGFAVAGGLVEHEGVIVAGGVPLHVTLHLEGGAGGVCIGLEGGGSHRELEAVVALTVEGVEVRLARNGLGGVALVVHELAVNHYDVVHLDIGVAFLELAVAKVEGAEDVELAGAVFGVGDVERGVAVAAAFGEGALAGYLADLTLDVDGLGGIVFGVGSPGKIRHCSGCRSGVVGIIDGALALGGAGIGTRAGLAAVAVEGVDVVALGHLLGVALEVDEVAEDYDFIADLDLVFGGELVAAEIVAAVDFERLGLGAVVGDEVGGVAVLGADFAYLGDLTLDVHTLELAVGVDGAGLVEGHLH